MGETAAGIAFTEWRRNDVAEVHHTMPPCLRSAAALRLATPTACLQLGIATMDRKLTCISDSPHEGSRNEKAGLSKNGQYHNPFTGHRQGFV